MSLFEPLSPEKIMALQKLAREHYVAGSPINGLWHPIIQRECVQMNEDAFRELYLKHAHRLGIEPDGYAHS